ncbi:MAG TPA: hypothetical protein VLS28_13175, partial [Candidatus Sulfomarinibacteraceae bacterium]|nr:hypothetical protein [Candidatus Sulfomarinibacteraceae bacterium]
MTILERAIAPTAPAYPRQGTVLALVAHARSVPSPRREAFAVGLGALGEGPGHVIVHTCHRVELYVAPAAFLGDLPALPPGGERFDDAAAARHLISVACGLDSAVLGETQILHQLRETIADRQSERALDPVLDRLFGAGLRAGRIARGWLNGSPRSLADVALDRIAKQIGPLEGRRILVVGAGRMGRLAVFAALRRGCSVAVSNRTAERAAQLAREVTGEAVPFGSTGAAPVDGVVVAIGGTWPLAPEDIAGLLERVAPVVDLSSPPAIPTNLANGLGTRFVSVDDLADDDHGPGERVRRRLETLISQTGR